VEEEQFHIERIFLRVAAADIVAAAADIAAVDTAFVAAAAAAAAITCFIPV